MDPTTIALFVARLVIASMFVVSAADKFGPDAKEVAMIRSLHLPAPAALKTATGSGEAIAAALLVLGLATRWAAAGLAMFTLVTTLAFLRWWSSTGGPDARISMRNGFFANAGACGGPITVATVGAGPLGLDVRLGWA